MVSSSKHITQSNYEENIRQIPFEGHFTQYPTKTLQKCQDHQKQGEKSVKLSQPKGTQSLSVRGELNETLEQKMDIRKN